MTVKAFLAEYARRFPENIDNGDVERFIKDTDYVVFDYIDGVFGFWHRDGKSTSLLENEDHTANGGNNGYMLDRDDYQFVLNELLMRNKHFKEWSEEHELDSNEYMVIEVILDKPEVEKSEISATFSFYGGDRY